MVDVTGITQPGTPNQKASKAVENAGGTLANRDTFLKLFTTQLKNQNPLKPKQSTKMVSQLATFSSVEQMAKTNENVGAILDTLSGNQIRQNLGYMGKRVTGPGNTIGLKNGSADIHYTLASDADQVAVKVQNEAGETVATLEGDTEQGQHTLDWDGLSDDGESLPDGSYKVSVNAKDVNGEPVSATTQTSGVVSNIRVDGDTTYLELGNGARIDASKVKAIESVDQAKT